MSIVRAALRIAVTQALKGKTVADDRVRDSSMVDLESGISATPNTIILVYTDESDMRPNDKAAWGGRGTTSLVLIVAVAGAQTFDDGTVEFSFPPTDHALELTLDVTERQIQMALMDPENEWAKIFRGLTTTIGRWRSMRGASTKEGTRFAARQIVIELETVQDPIPGRVVEGEWAKFIALLQDPSTTADIRNLAIPLRALMEGKPMPDWTRTMAEMGVNRDTLKAIGMAPVMFHPETPINESGTLHEIRIVGGDLETAVVPE